MSLRTDIMEEKIALDTVVQRSALGKHINETMLRPILDSVEMASRKILDDLGFMIVSEIQHRLATAPDGGTYSVYQFNEGAAGGRGDPKYTFLGYYTSSAKGGPPSSGGQTAGGPLPTGSLYESFWFQVDADGELTITIDSPQGSELDYFFKYGKIFLGVPTARGQALPVAEYFRILNNQTRPDWLRVVLDRKKKYWNDWMQEKFQKAVKQATKKWSVHRALKFSIYWENK